VGNEPIVGQRLEQVIIEDAPLLQRLFLRHAEDGLSVRVSGAPKLEFLGALTSGITKLELGTTVFKVPFGFLIHVMGYLMLIQLLVRALILFICSMANSGNGSCQCDDCCAYCENSGSSHVPS
jgi:hypothetical protein